METLETVIVGGGQAGIAMSAHLRNHGIGHVVLERDRIAERWRSARWDSLVANGPAWHDRFPGLEFDGDPEAFAPKERVADYFERYARMVDAPIRCGLEVTSVTRNEGRAGFAVETTAGTIEAQSIVAATGPFQTPVIPDLAGESSGINQLHSSTYRNPQQLPDGAVLVVGAGSSGGQIAEDLLRAGRQVYLAVGPHFRPPRRYRGRDLVWWLGVLGKWDAQTPQEGAEHLTIAQSGAYGGKTLDYRLLAEQGLVLVGRLNEVRGGVAAFANDLAETMARADQQYLSMLDEADAHVARMGLDLPEEPEARTLRPDPPCVTKPIDSLDLAAAGVTTILWATGFRNDYSWLKVDTFHPDGRPRHHRGVSEEPGVYFLGLPWLSRLGSPFIWGVWHDARFIADQIAIQRDYMQYHRDAPL